MSVHAAEQADLSQPLWFFAFQFDGGDNSAHDCKIPCGFWSSEKYPTSLPGDIIFDTTPQLECIEEGVKAPLFTSTQVLGDLIFTTQTKYASMSIWGLYIRCRTNITPSGRMLTDIVQLTEDELLALKDFQKTHHSTSSTDDRVSDYSGRDAFAMYDTDGQDNAEESLASSSRNDNHVLRAHCGSSESYHEATKDARHDSTDRYHSAEEDEATGIARQWGKCPS